MYVLHELMDNNTDATLYDANVRDLCLRIHRSIASRLAALSLNVAMQPLVASHNYNDSGCNFQRPSAVAERHCLGHMTGDAVN